MPTLTLQTAVEGIRYQTVTGVSAVPAGMQEHFVCLQLRRGELQITVDSTPVTLKPGDLCLIPPFTRHSIAAAENAVADVLTFTPHTCPDIYNLLNQLKLTTPRLPSDRIPPLVRELLASILSQISRMGVYSRTDKAVSYALPVNRSGYLQMYLSLFLLELMNAIPRSLVSNRDIDAMERVLRYCTANYSQELSRPAVARACEVSVGLVTQTFRQLGTSFRDYINDQRLTRAYQLLTTSKKPITDVIYDCGYTNQGTFNKNFLAKYGVTPRTVRQQAVPAPNAHRDGQ